MLASFSGSNGAVPIGGLVLSGSTLYGTTGGEVFSIPVGGGSPTVLASVSGINGGLVLSGSTFYGTTSTGGVSNDGTVFSIPVGGGSPTVLASFNGSNGANPPSGLVLSGGTLFGVTAAGGIWRRHCFCAGTASHLDGFHKWQLGCVNRELGQSRRQVPNHLLRQQLGRVQRPEYSNQ